ncbi:trappc1-1 [Symbiodinium microadriaticum]|nr:trappc1-1 [Symbiodinium microadriaticum]
MIYNLYIYDRKGKCLFYKEWSRPMNTLADDPGEEKRLMFGMLFSLKDLAAKLAPSIGPQGLHTVKTNAYTLHHFESVTGMSFIMNSDPSLPDLYHNLQHIYNNIFVECVIRNPLYRHCPHDAIDCPLFEKKLEDYVRTI